MRGYGHADKATSAGGGFDSPQSQALHCLKSYGGFSIREWRGSALDEWGGAFVG